MSEFGGGFYIADNGSPVPNGFYYAWCENCGCQSFRKNGDDVCLVCAGETVV